MHPLYVLAPRATSLLSSLLSCCTATIPTPLSFFGTKTLVISGFTTCTTSPDHQLTHGTCQLTLQVQLWCNADKGESPEFSCHRTSAEYYQLSTTRGLPQRSALGWVRFPV